MGTKRTAWHVFFGVLLRARGPRGIEVRDEVPLSDEPPRLDYLILRKTASFDPGDPGATLRGLWPHLPRVAAVELKSIGRPYRTGNLDRLWSYTHTVCAGDPTLLERRTDLCAVLVLPCRTPALDADVEKMGLAWEQMSPGYWELTGGLFALHLVEIDVVAEQEDDDLLRLFGHAEARTLEARRFWAEQVGSEEAKMAIQELEDYEEVMRKLLEKLPPERRIRAVGLTPEERVAGLAPEQRLAGLAPEQRVAGLAPEQVLAVFAPEQVVLALPDSILRGLSEEYIAALPEAAQKAIRARRGK